MLHHVDTPHLPNRPLVFLCHASADKPRVQTLAEDLRAAGVDVWLDEERIGPGDNLALKVSEGLGLSSHIVVCMSERFFTSTWVQHEWSTLFNREIEDRRTRVIPVLIDDFPKVIPPSFALLAAKRYIDLRGPGRSSGMTLLARWILDENAGVPEPGSPGILVRPRRATGVTALRRSTPRVGQVVDDLASYLFEQWEAEATRRRLHDPYAMAVPWRAAPAELVVAWTALTRLATSSPGWSVGSPDRWASGPEELSGLDNQLIDVLERVPTGRLVVLGEPGAGKTILLVRLLLDMLSRRRPGEPVPILLPLASWNPADLDLYTWIEQWLIRENPGLGQRALGRGQRTRARELLNGGHLTLLLDGLDELPGSAVGLAINAMNDAIRPGHRVVLASRSAAYRDAVHNSSEPEVLFAGAAGIELTPLPLDAVAEYLFHSSGSAGSARWGRAFEAFEAAGSSVVAETLRTPLMAALARAVYNPRPGEDPAVLNDPIELVDTDRFPTRQSVEFHLFDRFVPAAYRPLPDDTSTQRRFTPERVSRWLLYLARDLERRQHGATDLGWWRLAGGVGRWAPSVAVAIVGGLIGALGYSFPTDRAYAVQSGIGMIATIVTALLVRQLAKSSETGVAKALAGGLLGGLAGGLLNLVIYGSDSGSYVGSFIGGGLGFGAVAAVCGNFVAAAFGAAVGELVAAAVTVASFSHGIGKTHGWLAVLTNGGGIAVVAGVATYLALSSADSRIPARRLRWSPVGLLMGVGSGVTVGFITWIQFGMRLGLLVGIVATLGGTLVGFLFGPVATDLTEATTPRSVLARDRTAHFWSWLGMGVPYGLATGMAIGVGRAQSGEINGLRLGFGVGLANLLLVGGLFALYQASWGTFALARAWMAVRGVAPWRLMDFLDDAHKRRGVLRQVGASYQFRHIDLQRRLAGTPPTAIQERRSVS